MQITLPAGAREGRIPLPPSKSIAHRRIILSALAPSGGEVRLWSISNDIRATLDLVESLGGGISITEKNETYHIKISPLPKNIPAPVHIHVDESATTMRSTTAVSVDDNLATRKAGISVGATNNKFACWIDQIFYVAIEELAHFVSRLSFYAWHEDIDDIFANF